MKRIMTKGLLLAALSVFFASAAFAALSEEQHTRYWEKDKNYRVMYDLYDVALMNAYNLLEEAAFQALEKDNAAAVEKNAQSAAAAGKDEAAAYAFAYGRQILQINKLIAPELSGNDPLAGFYALRSDTLEGYMTAAKGGEDEPCELEFVVWSKAEPATFGRSWARVAALTQSFSTSSVQNPKDLEQNDDANLQIAVVIEGGSATVKTTEAFRKGGYVTAGMGEEYAKSALDISGTYVFEK